MCIRDRRSNGLQNLSKLVILDLLGKVVRTIDLRSFNQQQTFDISNLNTGVYFFQITSESSSESFRVIKY